MEAGHWKLDPAATEEAKSIFNGYEPTVKRNGRHYLLESTPHGRIELLSCGSEYLVAAEHPPQAEVDSWSLPLTQEMLHHLETNNLHPWTIVRNDELPAMLHAISEEEPHAQDSDEPWSPYICPMDTAAELIGEQREEVCNQLAALLEVSRIADPLPALIGPKGVGKHVLSVATAGQLDLEAIELPLGRLFVDRIFPTGFEVFLKTILAGGGQLSESDLLVVSDTELLDRLTIPVREQILRELSRLPRVVLLVQSFEADVAGIIALRCPGLADVDEAQQLLDIEFAGLSLGATSLEMFCRAAFAHEVGIIPSRFLSLVRLSLRLSNAGKDASVTLLPDDAAAAIGLMHRTWEC